MHSCSRSQVSVNYQSNMSFPAVTVCTLNKLSCTRLIERLLNHNHTAVNTTALCSIYDNAGCDRTVLDDVTRVCARVGIESFYPDDFFKNNNTHDVRHRLDSELNALDVYMQYYILPKYEDVTQL